MTHAQKIATIKCKFCMKTETFVMLAFWDVIGQELGHAFCIAESCFFRVTKNLTSDLTPKLTYPTASIKISVTGITIAILIFFWYTGRN